MKSLYAVALLLSVALAGAAWAEDAAPNVAPPPAAESAAKAAAPAEMKFDFNNKDDAKAALGDWQVTGDATVDAGKNHGDGEGGSLKIAPGAKAILKIADTDRVGSVTFWVYDDMSKPAEPKAAARNGPRWGLVDASGNVFGVGVLYAKYLAGDTSYTVSNVTDYKKGWVAKVVYIGSPRGEGWHQFTLSFDNEKGAQLAVDGKDVNAAKKRLDAANIPAKGFTTLVIFGDGSKETPQTIYVDDISVNVTGEAKAAEPAKETAEAATAEKAAE